MSSLIQKMSKKKSLINEASKGIASQTILNAVIDSVEQQTERTESRGVTRQGKWKLGKEEKEKKECAKLDEAFQHT